MGIKGLGEQVYFRPLQSKPDDDLEPASSVKTEPGEEEAPSQLAPTLATLVSLNLPMAIVRVSVQVDGEHAC